MFDRAILIVLDSCGIGSMPDAAEFGDDEPADTLGHIDRQRPLCRCAKIGRGGSYLVLGGMP